LNASNHRRGASEKRGEGNVAGMTRQRAAFVPFCKLRWSVDAKKDIGRNHRRCPKLALGRLSCAFPIKRQLKNE
jgi:hypothetical protein